MIRSGLCCLFLCEPIKFRTTTATLLVRRSRTEALNKLSEICAENARSLRKALAYCADNHIGAFRISSKILPMKTHSRAGYDIAELPGSGDIIAQFKECGIFARSHNIRLSFHPDQFVVINSPNPDVVRRSVLELEYQAEVAAWTGADVITIHAGGVYGDKAAAIARLEKNLDALPGDVRRLLAIENDDASYTPADLVPVCARRGVPFVYDVHHHRCCPDGRGVVETTDAAVATWDREPMFHVSSPRERQKGALFRAHGDYIVRGDIPACWIGRDITVDIEAKAKEKAVIRFMRDIGRWQAAAVVPPHRRTIPAEMRPDHYIAGRSLPGLRRRPIRAPQ